MNEVGASGRRRRFQEGGKGAISVVRWAYNPLLYFSRIDFNLIAQRCIVDIANVIYAAIMHLIMRWLHLRYHVLNIKTIMWNIFRIRSPMLTKRFLECQLIWSDLLSLLIDSGPDILQWKQWAIVQLHFRGVMPSYRSSLRWFSFFRHLAIRLSSWRFWNVRSVVYAQLRISIYWICRWPTSWGKFTYSFCIYALFSDHF